MLILRSILCVVACATLLTISLTGHAQYRKKTITTTIIGYVSDSACGLNHMAEMNDEKSCTLMCVKGGSDFVLADREEKKVYSLDKASQDKAREFAGQKVKITGRLTGKTIRVIAIEAAS
jgi:hypothetical protein